MVLPRGSSIIMRGVGLKKMWEAQSAKGRGCDVQFPPYWFALRDANNNQHDR